MAHHLAQLIEEAEVATGPEQPAKRNQVRDAILTVWAHRHQLHSGTRPFSAFEPVMATLERLDPENKVPRYLNPSRVPRSVSGETVETRQWLQLAEELDDAAKVLVDYCVTSAAQTALDQSEAWVELAAKAGIDEGFEFSLDRFLRDHSDLLHKPDPNERQRQILEDHLEKLELVLSNAVRLRDDIRSKLAASSPTSGEIGEDSQP
jgi:hypothetical protein